MEAARSALIIATDEYHDPKLRRLRAPVRDAEELGRVLGDRSIGEFDVEILLNEPEPSVRRKLAQFFANRNRDDLLLVHFSCHGLKDDDGNLYFATPDTEVEHLDATAVPSDFVNRQMQRSRSRRIALFLDCCYSGAFSRGAMARAGDGVQLAERFDGQGQVVITASNSMEYAFEGDELTGAGTPSVFTTALVEGLETGAADRDGDDLISIHELYDYVYDRVREHTPGMTPSKWTYDLQGELYVARNPKPRPVTPAELPSELRDALESVLPAVRLGVLGELERISAGTNVRLASAARLALEQLTEDDSRSVASAAATALGRGVPAAQTARESAVAASGPSPTSTVDPVEPPRPSLSEHAAPRVIGPPSRPPQTEVNPPVALAHEEPSEAVRASSPSRALRPRLAVLLLAFLGAVGITGPYVTSGDYESARTIYMVGLSVAIAAAGAIAFRSRVNATPASGALLGFGALTSVDENPRIVLFSFAVLAAGVIGASAVADFRGRKWTGRVAFTGRSVAPSLLAVAGAGMFFGVVASSSGVALAPALEAFAIGCALAGALLLRLAAGPRLVIAGALLAAGLEIALFFGAIVAWYQDASSRLLLGLGGGLALIAAGYLAYRAAAQAEAAEPASDEVPAVAVR